MLNIVEMKTFLTLFTVAILFSACGSKSDNTEAATIPTENSSDAPLINPPHGQPGHDHSVPDGAPLPQGNAPVQSESMPVDMQKTLKINPAHGQPGHRCDIAVGAPLS